MPFQVEGIHLLVGDLDTGRIVLRNQMGLDLKPSMGFRLPNVVQGEIKRPQGAASPSLADFAKQPVLNRIPFGGAGRIVTYRDRQAEAVRDFLLQLLFPDSRAGGIAAAAIGLDQQPNRCRKARPCPRHLVQSHAR